VIPIDDQAHDGGQYEIGDSAVTFELVNNCASAVNIPANPWQILYFNAAGHSDSMKVWDTMYQSQNIAQVTLQPKGQVSYSWNLTANTTEFKGVNGNGNLTSAPFDLEEFAVHYDPSLDQYLAVDLSNYRYTGPSGKQEILETNSCAYGGFSLPGHSYDLCNTVVASQDNSKVLMPQVDLSGATVQMGCECEEPGTTALSSGPAPFGLENDQGFMLSGVKVTNNNLKSTTNMEGTDFNLFLTLGRPGNYRQIYLNDSLNFGLAPGETITLDPIDLTNAGPVVVGEIMDMAGQNQNFADVTVSLEVKDTVTNGNYGSYQISTATKPLFSFSTTGPDMSTVPSSDGDSANSGDYYDYKMYPLYGTLAPATDVSSTVDSPILTTNPAEQAQTDATKNVQIQAGVGNQPSFNGSFTIPLQSSQLASYKLTPRPNDIVIRTRFLWNPGCNPDALKLKIDDCTAQSADRAPATNGFLYFNNLPVVIVKGSAILVDVSPGQKYTLASAISTFHREPFDGSALGTAGIDVVFQNVSLTSYKLGMISQDATTQDYIITIPNQKLLPKVAAIFTLPPITCTPFNYDSSNKDNVTNLCIYDDSAHTTIPGSTLKTVENSIVQLNKLPTGNNGPRPQFNKMTFDFTVNVSNGALATYSDEVRGYSTVNVDRNTTYETDSPVNQEDTFVHELMHAVDNSLGSNQDSKGSFNDNFTGGSTAYLSLIHKLIPVPAFNLVTDTDAHTAAAAEQNAALINAPPVSAGTGSNLWDIVAFNGAYIDATGGYPAYNLKSQELVDLVNKQQGGGSLAAESFAENFSTICIAMGQYRKNNQNSQYSLYAPNPLSDIIDNWNNTYSGKQPAPNNVKIKVPSNLATYVGYLKSILAIPQLAPVARFCANTYQSPS